MVCVCVWGGGRGDAVWSGWFEPTSPYSVLKMEPTRLSETFAFSSKCTGRQNGKKRPRIVTAVKTLNLTIQLLHLTFVYTRKFS
jgi:hypothetical protein